MRVLEASAMGYTAAAPLGGSGITVDGTTGAFAADWVLARSLVPEPTSLAVIGLGGLVLDRRRRG